MGDETENAVKEEKKATPPTPPPTKGKKMPKKTDSTGKTLRGVQIPTDAIPDLRRIKAHLELENGESYSLGRAAEYAIKETLEHLEEG